MRVLVKRKLLLEDSKEKIYDIVRSVGVLNQTEHITAGTYVALHT